MGKAVKLGKPGSLYNKFGGKQQENFFSQISFMLNSGFRISEAIGAIEEFEKGFTKRFACVVKQDLASGIGISESFAERGKGILPRIIPALMQTAEITGELGLITQKISENIKYSNETKSKLIGAAAYPMVIFFFGSGVCLFLMLSIIPNLTSKLINKGKAVPGSAQFFLDISEFILGNWQNILMIIVGGLVCFIIGLKIGFTRFFIEKFIFRIPIVGDLMLYYFLGQFSYTLTILLKAQISLVESLDTAINVMGSEVFRRNLVKAKASILGGAPLSTTLDKTLYPQSFISFVKFGEKSGELPSIIERVADFYKSKLENLIQLATSLMEPGLLVGIGGFVGAIYFAFFETLLALQS